MAVVVMLGPVLGSLDSSASALSSAAESLHIGKSADNYWSAMPSSPSSYCVSPNTKLTFQYSRYHNVYLMPSEAAYDACDFSSATELASDSFGAPNTLNIYEAVATSAGTLYIACGKSGHCTSDQKIAISVQADCSGWTAAEEHVAHDLNDGQDHSGHDHDHDNDDDDDEDEDEQPCFPSSSLVTRADGSLARLDSLRPGDSLVAATADGLLRTDTVSRLSIADTKADAAVFMVLALEGARRNLTLTAEHHLPVGSSCCSELKQAKDVAVGDVVWCIGTAIGGRDSGRGSRSQSTKGEVGPPSAVRVVAITKATLRGLHSPVLTKGGFPIVDGVVTAFDSLDKVTLAAWTLPLLEMSGTVALARWLLLPAERKYLGDVSGHAE